VDDINFSNSPHQLPGESFMQQKAVKISSKMQNIIQLQPSFTKKPIGPVYQFLSSHFQSQLPVAFLNAYVVTNEEDAALLKALCMKSHEPIPDVIVYPFAKVMYDDLKKDSRVDPGAVEALSKENPTLANVLIDYFELHKFGKMKNYAMRVFYLCVYMYIGRPVVINPYDEDILDASVDSSTSDQQGTGKHGQFICFHNVQLCSLS